MDKNILKKKNILIISASILILVFIFSVAYSMGRNSIDSTQSINEDITLNTVENSEVTNENIAEVTSELQPTLTPTPTEAPPYPLLDEKVTESLATMMYENFGGFGKEEFSTSWYKYIDYWEVYQNETSYSGTLYLNEQPYDYSMRLLLGQYYSPDELDVLCPILMDVGASFGLDDADLCIIGEDLYNISTSKDAKLYYSSMEALEIPVYDFLSKGFGRSAKEVKSAIQENQIPGAQAYDCIVDYMSYTYEGAFNGLSMEKVKQMSMAAIANFNDVRIETLAVFDQNETLLNTYEN